MNIKGYELTNDEKVVRAAEGTPVSNGELVGGVGYEDEALLLATYDKLGGLITKKGYKIKTGSFFDFKKNIPIAKLKPVFVVRVDGDEVEVPEGEPMPMEVQAQDILKENRAKKAGAKKGKKAKPTNEVEE